MTAWSSIRSICLSAATGLVLVCGAAVAAERSGVEMPDRWTHADNELTLNGIGVREYGVFKNDVYVAALYLPQKESDAGKLLDADTPWVIHMQYKRSGGSREEAAKAWTHFLRGNCEALGCDYPDKAAEKFLGWVGPAKKGGTETFAFGDGALTYRVGDSEKGRVESETLARLLLASFIGPEPSTEDLRAQLLGKDD